MRGGPCSCVLSFALLALSVAAPHQVSAQLKPLAAYKEGQAVFTQGREVTWQLFEGTAETMAEPPATIATFGFAPGGRFVKVGDPALRLTVMKMGDFVDLQVLAVVKGPGGDATYRARQAKCALTVRKLDASGAEGSVTCSGAFEGGSPITKLEFTAK